MTAAARRTKAKAPTCPNCTGKVGHKENGCALATLMGVVRDRGEKTETEIRTLWAAVDTDALWDRLGPIADELETGELAQVGT